MGKVNDTLSFSQLSIVRLRLIFLGAGLILVGAVLALSYVMHKQIKSAVRDREEMVALRVFDELEREISAFLDGENAREPYRNLPETNPELWAPFVVGYFTASAQGSTIVAADGATSENERRMNWSVERLEETLRTQARSTTTQPSLVRGAEQAPETSTAPAHQELTPLAPEMEESSESSRSGAAPGSKIIDSLNRAPERRKPQVAPQPANKKTADPFSDYAQRF